MNLLLAATRRLAHAAWRRRVLSAFARADTCALLGLNLVIEPGVLHPAHFASSQVLARHLMTLELRGLRVADIGAGSGFLSLIAARAGASVIATDINPVAVACARENASRNGLADRVELVRGDVFDGVTPDGRFDLVLTNPPFYPRAARSPFDQAFAAGAGYEFFVKLASGLPQRMKEDGALLLIHSSDADFSPIARILGGKGLVGRTVFEQGGLFETLTIKEFRTPRTAPGAQGT